MSCGVSPNYAHCALECELNTNGGSFGTLAGLLDYCILSSSGVEKNCVMYYLSCVNTGYPPNYSSGGSLAGSSSQLYSSTSSECPSGGGEFDWDSVSSGFADAFPVFVVIFGVWAIIKIFRMSWW